MNAQIDPGKRTAGRRRAVRWAAGATGVAAGAAAWWLTDSAPYPYSQHWLLDLPLPFLSLRRLDSLLQARASDRILEVGPGTGLQALHVAPQLSAGGQLDIVDIQQEMLDHATRRAQRQGVDNIVPTLADAHDLPFDDGVFDAAYLVTALGEIPDPVRTLTELRRVMKPTGRLIVGEFFDRHQIRPARLIEHAARAGLRVGTLIGPPIAYYARLHPYVDATVNASSAGSRTAHAPLTTLPDLHLPPAGLVAALTGPQPTGGERGLAPIRRSARRTTVEGTPLSLLPGDPR